MFRRPLPAAWRWRRRNESNPLTEILVVANETLGGRRLRELLAQKAKVNESLVIRLVIPQSRPRRVPDPGGLTSKGHASTFAV